jgi:hypothetical protein
MSANEIIEKLQVRLEQPIESEDVVVYILSRIRKLIEDDGVSRLKDFCNWSLHVRINDSVRLLGNDTDVNMRALIENLRSDLSEFLKNRNLPLELVIEDGRWNRFANLYLSVTSEVPLVRRNDTTH